MDHAFLSNLYQMYYQLHKKIMLSYILNYVEFLHSVWTEPSYKSYNTLLQQCLKHRKYLKWKGKKKYMKLC